MTTERPQGVLPLPPRSGSQLQSEARDALTEFLAEQSATLLVSIRLYVQRMGLARGAGVQATAQEVLQEVAVEALGHAERFDPTRQPLAWLLGISMNIIKRKRAESVRRSQHEFSIVQLAHAQADTVSESETLDQLLPIGVAGPESSVESDEQAQQLLGLVSEEDQRILRLAFLYHFEREALAQQLGITSGAARVRLHRALGRLRSAWQAQPKVAD